MLTSILQIDLSILHSSILDMSPCWWQPSEENPLFYMSQAGP